jgi:hypothetical protein
MKGFLFFGVVCPIWIKFVTGDLDRNYLVTVICVIHFGQYSNFVK